MTLGESWRLSVLATPKPLGFHPFRYTGLVGYDAA
jgi:hypothetical protein